MVLTDKDTITNRYIRKQINKYKKRKAQIVTSGKQIKGVAVRRWIHPLLIKVLQIKSFFCGMTYEIISDESNPTKGETVIYAVTHIAKCDYEMVIEACNIFAYAFAGDWETMYATVEDYFFRVNGVLYVDTGDKEDRKNSSLMMQKTLKQGVPVIIFPEGVWNLTENLPMLKIFPGVVQASKTCQVPIIPIAVEQVEKHFLINVGSKMSFDEIEETTAVQQLRDTLSTLRWEIWEKLPLKKRKDIPADYHEKFVDERLAEYVGFNREVIANRIYKDKTDREILAIKSDLERVKTLNKK